MRIKLINAVTVVAFVIVSINIVVAQPANDNWESAVTIAVPSLTTGNNLSATIQACEQHHNFPDHAVVPAKSSVWYKFVVPENGSYTVRTFETNFDLIVSAYRILPGFCNGGTANVPYRVTESMAYNAHIGHNEYGRISFRAMQGQLIHVAVDSVAQVTGDFKIVVEKTKYQYGVQLDHGDSAADFVVNDTNTDFWISRNALLPQATSHSVIRYGQSLDKRFAADFDGDGVSDFAVARPDNGKLTWWVTQTLGYQIKLVQFGLEFDRPIVGDWDGDGMADIAVTRADGAGKKIWHILRSSDGQYQTFQYGLDQDKEMVGDYDGDGKTDLVVLRKNASNTFTWYIRLSSTGANISREFGEYFTDAPQAADFDGDGKTDITMFRNGTWYSLDSSSAVPLEQRPTRIVRFGSPGDRPQVADYDGDRKSDYAVWRSGTWWILNSRNGGVKTYQFGANYHIPMSDGGIYQAYIQY